MSLSQTCAEAEAVIARTRSLFGGSAQALNVPDASGQIASAAQAVVKARAGTADLGGAAIRAYQAMAERSVPPLTTAAASDSSVAGHLTTADAAMQAGAARLDQIAATTKTISNVAPMANTPAGELAILKALRTQVAQAAQVAQSTHQQAAALSTQIRGLQYPKKSPPSSPDDRIVDDGNDQSAPTIQAASFGAPPPLSPPLPEEPVPPPPSPPEPIRLPPRTESPPPTVIDASPPKMFPNCDNTKVWLKIGQGVLGGLGIAGGALATPFTFGGGVVPILAGAAAVGEAAHEIGQCS